MAVHRPCGEPVGHAGGGVRLHRVHVERRDRHGADAREWFSMIVVHPVPTIAKGTTEE